MAAVTRTPIHPGIHLNMLVSGMVMKIWKDKLPFFFDWMYKNLNYECMCICVI